MACLASTYGNENSLPSLILCLVDDQGELDSDALQRRAVIKFLSANAENSSTTTGIAVKDA